MRGTGPWRLVAVALVVVAVLEVYLIVQAAQAIGVGWTVLVLLALSVLGGVLLKREGMATWRALTEALASHRMPGRELADAFLVLLGGSLLLVPGFVTDAVGLLLVLPFTRPLARTALAAFLTRRYLDGSAGPAPDRSQARRSPGTESDSVVRGEVVD